MVTILHGIYVQDVDQYHLCEVVSYLESGIKFCSENAMSINVDRVYIQLEIRVGPCWKFPLRCWVRLSAFPTEVR